jgi:hypothetical protein
MINLYPSKNSWSNYSEKTLSTGERVGGGGGGSQKNKKKIIGLKIKFKTTKS